MNHTGWSVVIQFWRIALPGAKPLNNYVLLGANEATYASEHLHHLRS